MTLDAKLSVRYGVQLASAVDLGAARADLSKSAALALANGTGAGQADRAWADTITLAASANQDIDLAGALLDALGGPFSLARVRGLLVAAAAGNTNNVVVGAAAANAWTGLLGATHTVTLRPGAVFAAFCGAADASGYAVTGGTGDLLRVANSGAGTPVTLDVVVIGASA